MGHLILKGALLGPTSNPFWNSMPWASSLPVASLSFPNPNGERWPGVAWEVRWGAQGGTLGGGERAQLWETRVPLGAGWGSHPAGGDSGHLAPLP